LLNNKNKRVIIVPLEFNSLTSKQKRVYLAIESYIKAKGIPPTVREIGEMVGEKTPGAVQGILNRLEQKGVIKREIGMARSIQLVTDDSQYVKPIYVPEIKKVSNRNIDDLLNIYNINRYHPISPDLAGSSEICFLLNCGDSSLLESDVKQGDMVAICRESCVNEGDMVLAMYENHVLLRRFHKNENPDLINLKADNYLIDKEVFQKDEVTIIGKVLGKYSKF
jgi:repressor LexA